MGIVVTGCAGSMTADQCVGANWRSLGHADGVAGHDLGVFDRRQKECGEHGVTVDHAAYDGGRDEGLQLYCTPRNGFAVGSAGQRYKGVCPAALEVDFQPAYVEGRTLYSLQQSLDTAERELSRLRRRIASMIDDYNAKAREANDRGTPQEQRAQLREDLPTLKATIDDGQKKAARQLGIVENAQRKLEDYRSTLLLKNSYADQIGR